jgi:plasmid stabilization system protein ParE
MSYYIVRELPKARWDKRHIVEWLHQRSPSGAAAWLRAYDRMVEQLAVSADSFGDAYENPDLELDIKEALFKTRRGRVYRALFLIEQNDVYVLRVRGPGQGSIEQHDL